MTSRNRIPAPLEPYLRLPPELSLILLIGTLGCSTTWLTSRYVSSILTPSQTPDVSSSVDGETGNAVVLVSWLRDEKFWRDEIRRTSGQDISRLSSTGHFAFIDALTLLATTKPEVTLSSIQNAMEAALAKLSTSSHRITLILDQPDTLLATSPTPTTTTHLLNTLVLHLRGKVHATVLTLSADLPLVSASVHSTTHSNPNSHSAFASSAFASSGTPTPLEIATAGFLVQQAHAARFVMGVRELETGSARDVSGVLRVTRGGDAESQGYGDGDGDEKGEKVGDEVGEGDVKEMEALFLVGRDGGVKVFGRGSGMG